MPAQLRSQRLNRAIHAPHQQLDALVKSYTPFDSREHFAHFVVAQYRFQRALQPLYRDPRLVALIPDLAERCRAQQAADDLIDLGIEIPPAEADTLGDLPVAAALGWLFVSEGSKLGAAFLIKRAAALGLSESFGARHLGEPAGGRAEGWKRFTRMLDGLALSEHEDTLAEHAAGAAFERFTVLLRQAYAHTAPA
ncbi:biliverdin-producing heme oxygenase [Pseudomonas typographi]|uniref:biliverdin-producing heme oxygenase n=1 Tax=Pseudomonas typographi TaxID=2715964 RepID=UPI0016858735|nr:biliverdin-producing heme oxygenase [Pseudomonas typographi]MBD1550971.1 biliverdin-producing heme oxygenase [Pseudomonas typographi]